MKFGVFTSGKGRLKGHIQPSKPGLCSQNIDHYNFIGVTNDPSNESTPDNSGGEAGLGAAHLPTCIDLSYVL